MSDIIQTIMALIVVAAIFIGLATFVGLMNKLYCQRIIKLVESGEMSDEELTKNYNMSKKIKIIQCGHFLYLGSFINMV